MISYEILLVDKIEQSSELKENSLRCREFWRGRVSLRSPLPWGMHLIDIEEDFYIHRKKNVRNK